MDIKLKIKNEKNAIYLASLLMKNGYKTWRNIDKEEVCFEYKENK